MVPRYEASNLLCRPPGFCPWRPLLFLSTHTPHMLSLSLSLSPPLYFSYHTSSNIHYIFYVSLFLISQYILPFLP